MRKFVTLHIKKYSIDVLAILTKMPFFLVLVHSQLSQVYRYTDPDEALEIWYKTFSSVYNKHVPFMTKCVKYTRKPPWLSKEIEETIIKRDRLLKAREHEEFKKQRNKVTSLIRASKKQQHTFKI